MHHRYYELLRLLTNQQLISYSLIQSFLRLPTFDKQGLPSSRNYFLSTPSVLTPAGLEVMVVTIPKWQSSCTLKHWTPAFALIEATYRFTPLGITAYSFVPESF